MQIQEIQGLKSRFIFAGSLEILDLPEWRIIPGQIDPAVWQTVADCGSLRGKMCKLLSVACGDEQPAGYRLIVFPSNFLPVLLSLPQSRLVIH